MFISVYKYIICRYKCFISVLYKCVICRYKYFISGYKCFKVAKVVKVFGGNIWYTANFLMNGPSD